MIPAHQIGALASAKTGRRGLWDILVALGLTGSCVLCLDAGDAASYDGTGQVWVDRSGNLDFNRGTTSGSEASDPTFNGSAGGNSAGEFFSSDATPDVFTAVSNPSFFQNAHKDASVLSFVSVSFVTDFGSNVSLLDTLNVSSHGLIIGSALELSKGARSAALIARTGSATTTLQWVLGSTGDEFSGGSLWYFIGGSLQEGVASGSHARVNSTTTGATTQTMTSPSTTNGQTPEIKLADSAGDLAMLAVFSSALTAQNLTDIYDAIKLLRPGYSLP